MTKDNWTLLKLEAAFPSIRWRDPVMLHWDDGAGGEIEKYCCRVCIANRGLSYASAHQWNTFKDCQAHISKEHAEP